jgi:hypothetical protein
LYYTKTNTAIVCTVSAETVPSPFALLSFCVHWHQRVQLACASPIITRNIGKLHELVFFRPQRRQKGRINDKKQPYQGIKSRQYTLYMMNAALEGDMKMAASPSGDKHREDYSDDDDDGARISAPSADMKFQPLPETAATSKAPPLTRQLRSRTRATSATQAIPKTSTHTQDVSSSRTSSAAASPEHGFMNNILDPIAATANTTSVAPAPSSQQLSHTPPTASSYEANHFGKRPRTGVS